MNQKLVDFLRYTNSQNEVSLIISQTPEELEDHIKTLNQCSFEMIASASELLLSTNKQSKKYFISIEPLSPFIFDFICQYPQQKILLSDNDQSLREFSITHENSSLVLIITDDALTKTIDSNMDLLNKVGIIFRQEK